MKTFRKQIFIFIICILLSPISAQARKNSNSSKPAQSTTQKIQKDTLTILEKDIQRIVEEKSIIMEKKNIAITQKSLDRSINILNTVATSMGVLVGLLTLIIVIGAGFGIWDYRTRKKYLDEIEKDTKEAKALVEGTKPIIERLKKAEQEIITDRSEISLPPLSEHPSEELKKKMDELVKKIEFIETFGVSLKPEDYFARGTNFFYKNEYDKAIKCFDEAIKLKSDYADAWHNKGFALGKLIKYDEAIKCFDEAIKLNPKDNKTWYNKACIYSLKGDKEQSLEYLKRAIELYDKNKEVAKKDKDFETLQKDDDFKRIVS